MDKRRAIRMAQKLAAKGGYRVVYHVVPFRPNSHDYFVEQEEYCDEFDRIDSVYNTSRLGHRALVDETAAKVKKMIDNEEL